MPAFSPGGGLADAPSDGMTYTRRNAAWKPYFIFSGYVANVWFPPDFGLTPATGSSTAAGTIYFSPLVIYERVTISTLAITVSVAGSNCNIAIYPSDPTSKRPLVAAAPLASTGSFAIGSATTFSPALTTPVTLDPGLYWLAHNTDAVATINCQTSTQVWAMNYTGASTAAIAASTANAGKYHFELVGAFASGWPTSGTPTEVAGTTHAAYITFMPSIVY